MLRNLYPACLYVKKITAGIQWVHPLICNRWADLAVDVLWAMDENGHKRRMARENKTGVLLIPAGFTAHS